MENHFPSFERCIFCSALETMKDLETPRDARSILSPSEIGPTLLFVTVSSTVPPTLSMIIIWLFNHFPGISYVTVQRSRSLPLKPLQQ